MRPLVRLLGLSRAFAICYVAVVVTVILALVVYQVVTHGSP